ncbi:hypothetical protein Bca52824_016271 [Brassica carinata]|uniref:Uncharacterized protein n=1 Tax=Brassica carinata TaxID=52824 RepID=A0A8X7W3A9_BRACI|nr:hypothetical protein Bca52824_016271 [Brassica carinata]
MEKAVEYQRALTPAKLEKIFARPFVGAMDGPRDGISCMAKNPNYLKGIFSASMDGVSTDGNVLASAIVAYIDARRDRDMLEPTSSEDQSERERNDQLYRQLKQELVEFEESKREAYKECVRRFKAENTAVEPIRKTREYEAMFNEEARLRKEGKEALAKQRKLVEKTKKERDNALIIILNGRKLYSEELRRRVEAEEMLGKEKEEHERTKKELEEVWVIVQDGMQLYNEQLRQRKEMEESVKRQEEELEKTNKEKESFVVFFVAYHS